MTVLQETLAKLCSDNDRVCPKNSSRFLTSYSNDCECLEVKFNFNLESVGMKLWKI